MEEVNKLGKILIVDDNEDVSLPSIPTRTLYRKDKGSYHSPTGLSIL